MSGLEIRREMRILVLFTPEIIWEFGSHGATTTLS